MLKLANVKHLRRGIARSWSWAIVLPLSGFGLLLGHKIDYLLIPAEDRAHVLGHTAHGYVANMFAAAAMGALVATILVVASSVIRGAHGRPQTSLRGVAPRLALVQSAGFVTLEVLERAWSGPVAHHLELRILALGVVAQVLLAVFTAAILKWLSAKGHELSASFATTPAALCETSVFFFTRETFVGVARLKQLIPRAPPASCTS